MNKDDQHTIVTAPSSPTVKVGRKTVFLGDKRFEIDGGWKVHLTIEPDSYQRKAAAIRRWLKRVFAGQRSNIWKHLQEDGTKYQKDFTIYLGSYATMLAFVDFVEASSVLQHVDASKAGTSDRIVGKSGKCAARFDPRGKTAGHLQWFYGWEGTPFEDSDKRAEVRISGPALSRPVSRESMEAIAIRPKTMLRQMFGDYFLPEGVD